MSEKPFRPLLATDADMEKLRFPVMASPKLDGIRCLAMNGKPMSRSMKVLPSKHVQAFFQKHADILEGLDGELIVGDPTAPDVYRTTTSHVMAEDKVFDFTYVVFDQWKRSNAFEHGLGDPGEQARYEETYRALEESLSDLPDRADLLMHEKIYDLAALEAYEERTLSAGFEGVMLRDPNGIYKQGRSSVREGILLKVKRHMDAEAVVIGTEEEMHNANEAQTNELGRTKRSTAKDGLVGKGTMGALIVRGLNGPFKDVEFNIGSGFTAADRRDEWPNGTIVTYKFFNVGVKDKPRHPVYKGRRDPIDMGEAA